jgi:hypothetical protein
MDEIEEDFSIMGYRALGVTMASQKIAMTMAELIFKNTFGEDDFKTQLPLKVSDGGDRWIIEGSRNGDDYPVPDGELHNGQAIIEILKVNCQVLKLTQMCW